MFFQEYGQQFITDPLATYISMTTPYRTFNVSVFVIFAITLTLNLILRSDFDNI